MFGEDDTRWSLSIRWLLFVDFSHNRMVDVLWDLITNMILYWHGLWTKTNEYWTWYCLWGYCLTALQKFLMQVYWLRQSNTLGIWPLCYRIIMVAMVHACCMCSVQLAGGSRMEEMDMYGAFTSTSHHWLKSTLAPCSAFFSLPQTLFDVRNVDWCERLTSKFALCVALVLLARFVCASVCHPCRVTWKFLPFGTHHHHQVNHSWHRMTHLMTHTTHLDHSAARKKS